MNELPSNDRPRVLVIDDDPLFRSLITTLLRKEYFVAVAADGAEGFYKAAEHPPDIVLIDVQMPGWDGIKTLKHFRGHPSLSHVSLVMLTSDSTRDTVMAAIQAGAQDYIVKTSFSKEDLFNKLARLDPRRKMVMQRVEAQAAAALGVSRATTASPATGFAAQRPITPVAQAANIPVSPLSATTPMATQTAVNSRTVPPPSHREAFGVTARMSESQASRPEVTSGASALVTAHTEMGAPARTGEHSGAVAASAKPAAEDQNRETLLRDLIDNWE
ncbi:response regulator receiver [Planctopirus limnophila DSM 3776]|uniref:Response regulator receiver n=1 Tax=Planctopirus limnophila (strain ATCC 43296 / DSM 3776 / IFAM 1008 / Mu 290) TaxID=521674 RepID=D5SNH6_PLAL2|nr:response regulator [Planctopirus limnophila]ADG68090.1 response regulator receiver [Planctopirus limnophila DSM 3776]